MRSRGRKAGVLLISIGALLIMSAVALVVYNILDDRRAGVAADSVFKQFSIEEPAEGAVPDYKLDPNREMPTKKIGGYLYIGKVSVPALDLKLPVMDTWDYTRMKISPCRYTGTAYLPGFVICAHNYSSHFGRLKNLMPRDKIKFTDVDGNVFNYEVARIETLSSTAVEEMKSGGWDLTLFTCTPGGAARVAIRCRKQEER